MSASTQSDTVQADGAPPGRALRVLMIASCFPSPFNDRLGTWAKGQAVAVQAHVGELRVLSPQSYLPPPVRWLKRHHWLSKCPRRHRWGALEVDYPRWLYYSVDPLKRWAYARPDRQMGLAWGSIRGTVLRAVRDFQPDVVLAHHSAVNGYIAMRTKELTGVPFVVADWDFDEITDCEKLPGRRDFMGRVVEAAGGIICTSLRMERDFKRIWPGAPAKAIHFGRPPLPESIFATPRPPEIQEKTVILSVSSFVARKGMPMLARAFARVASRHPNAILRLGGDGPELAATRQVVADAGIEDQVHVLGPVPHDRVLQEMAWCDFFASPGWDEPFATVFVEAMAAGKAIVYASDGGIADLARDGVHGVAVEPRSLESTAAALEALLSDPAGRVAMGEAGRQLFSSELTADACGRKIAAMLDDVRRRAAVPGGTR